MTDRETHVSHTYNHDIYMPEQSNRVRLVCGIINVKFIALFQQISWVRQTQPLERHFCCFKSLPWFSAHCYSKIDVI